MEKPSKAPMTFGFVVGAGLQMLFWSSLMFGLLLTLVFKIKVAPFRYLGF